MRNRLSFTALEILSDWRRVDRKFFRKYSKDENVMSVVASLAEMIVTFDSESRSHPLFHC